MHRLVLIISVLIKLSVETEINITKFRNCFDDTSTGEEWPIEIQDVHYDFNDNGFIDHVHGKYLVRTIDTRDKELTITVYKCSIDDPLPCEHQIGHTMVDLHCDKFRNDGSGIWRMISQAMNGSTCGEETVTRMSHKYFAKYLTGNEKNSRYRMHLLFHKKRDESKDRRACAEIFFDVFV